MRSLLQTRDVTKKLALRLPYDLFSTYVFYIFDMIDLPTDVFGVLYPTVDQLQFNFRNGRARHVFHGL